MFYLVGGSVGQWRTCPRVGGWWVGSNMVGGRLVKVQCSVGWLNTCRWVDG